MLLCRFKTTTLRVSIKLKQRPTFQLSWDLFSDLEGAYKCRTAYPVVTRTPLPDPF